MRSILLLFLLLCALLTGCAHSPMLDSTQGPPFNFETDTLAYPNELVWEYHFDPVTGERTTHKRQPPPTYSHHCFVVVYTAAQFFRHARFAPSQPVADEATYRRLINEILERNPRKQSAKAPPVVIPGYANLRQFSAAREPLLKRECGGTWKSYVQRGHWRIVLPFSRGHQEDTMRTLWSAVRNGRVPIVHLICFPELTINHALLVFAARPSLESVRFDVYDPNHPEGPSSLIYNRNTGRFELPPNRYFAGGNVDVYQIYCGWLY